MNIITPISEIKTLSNLRWLAIAAQVLVAVLVQSLLGVNLNWMSLGALFAIETISNIALMAYTHRANTQNRVQTARRAHLLMLVIMVLDTILLTLMLSLSGGPLNPFSFLYMVHVAMGAVMLSTRGAVGIAAICCVAYGSLFLLHPAEGHHHHHHHDPGLLRLHLEGMWYAFAIASVLVLWFVVQIRRTLRQREEALATLQATRIKEERLASLATLSASAAHELSTPLSTIALVSKELERALLKANASAELIDDAKLMRQQVDHCHAILRQMASDAGQNLGELLSKVTIEEITTTIHESFPEVLMDVTESAKKTALTLPIQAFIQTLSGLIRNAQDASELVEGATITLSIESSSDHVVFIVKDTAGGMEDEIKSQALQPFFSTKNTQKNLGLGLFLARSLTERLGGTFKLESTPGQGTQLTMRLPRKGQHVLEVTT